MKCNLFLLFDALRYRGTVDAHEEGQVRRKERALVLGGMARLPFRNLTCGSSCKLESSSSATCLHEAPFLCGDFHAIALDLFLLTPIFPSVTFSLIIAKLTLLPLYLCSPLPHLAVITHPGHHSRILGTNDRFSSSHRFGFRLPTPQNARSQYCRRKQLEWQLLSVVRALPRRLQRRTKP